MRLNLGVRCAVNLFRRTAQWLFTRRKPQWEPVITDAMGFSIGARRFDWTDIHSIAAFKRDQVTFDDVWFQIEGPGEAVMVCEEQPGFEAFEAALVRRFPSAAAWRNHVLQPAFARQFTVLYRRT